MSKIINNSSVKEILGQIKSVESLEALCRAVPVVKKLLPGLPKAFDKFQELKKQAEIFLVPDQFNETFSSAGWIAYESMNLNVMVSAIEIAGVQGMEAAEELLADYYNAETLKWGIMRFHGHPDFRKRIRLAELAKEDYLTERYHACIPLTLSLLDGLVNDVSKHVGFFAENADMIAWDCIAAHETGLMSLAKVMRLGRNKTNEEQIRTPYRNGILHGRDLSYDNKIVAAKCWAALFAVRDWAGALADGKATPKQNEQISWSVLFRRMAETERLKKALNDWVPRKSCELNYLPCSNFPSLLPDGTPERAAAEFLENWRNTRFGLMAGMLLDFSNASKGKKAGWAKEDFGRVILDSYSIVAITDEASAISQVEVDLHINCRDSQKPYRISMRMVHTDEDNQPAARGFEDGTWRIAQHCFNSVLYEPIGAGE